jgi:hypothetical protein
VKGYRTRERARERERERGTLFACGGTEKEQCFLEGSQASSACPADKSRVKVKKLDWLDAVA